MAVWHRTNVREHMALVENYLRDAGNFGNIRGEDRSPHRLFSDPLYAVIGESTGS